MSKRTLAILFLASGVPMLWGDVTISYRNSLTFGAAMPGPVAERTKNGTESALPASTVRYRKGNREYLKSGAFACLMDFDRQTITILDAGRHRFATVAMKDYVNKLAAAMPTLPPQYQGAQAAAKTTLSSRKTGKTDTLQGIPAEETEIVASVDLPAPDAQGEMKSQTLVRVTMRVWTAKAGQGTDSAAVRELTAHAWPDAGFSSSIDPTNIVAMTFGAMPGMGDALSRMFQDVENSHAVVLKAHLEASLPMMAGFLRQMRKEQPDALRQGLDENAPFGVMDCEAEEISTAPVDYKMLRVPVRYKAAPFEEVIRAVSPEFPKS